MNSLKLNIKKRVDKVEGKEKKGFTLIEILITMAIVGIISGVTVNEITGAITEAEDVRRVTDAKAISDAMEQEKGLTGTEYLTSVELPTSIGPLTSVPENNLENNGKYEWFDNTGDSSVYCIWATLSDDDNASQKKYFVANQFGAGYFEEEPESLYNCGYYLDESEGNEWLNEADDDEVVEDPEVPDPVDRVYVCHQNKKGKAKTLLISYNGAQAHLAHGDYLGECIN